MRVNGYSQRSGWKFGFGAALGVAVALAGCADDDAAGAADELRTAGMSWEEFRAGVYQEPDTGVYIVDGDTPVVGDEALAKFYADHFQSGALAVHRAGGADVIWPAGQRNNLTYCVSTGFGSNYSRVVNAMREATAAWEGAANVTFVYVPAQDGNCTASNNSVLFNVRNVSGQPYLARAFFPNDGRAAREVLVDSGIFGNIAPVTLTGILRHELGHTLGFRHEHTRPEAGTCFEDNNWRGLTTYDAASVMHYPQCNGSNTGDLRLTALDRQGARNVYGVSTCVPCPLPNSSYDGANCYRGTAPAGTTPFTLGNNLYYSPLMAPTCPMANSAYDGANCHRGLAPAGTTPFLYAGNFYYTALPGNSCPLAGSFYDGANCFAGTPPAGTSPFIYANRFYYTAVMAPTCPLVGSGYDGANCFAGTAPIDTFAFAYQGNLYYSPSCIP